MTVILIVEDDDDVRALVEISFRLAGGWTLHTASSAAEAIAALAAGGIDAVLSDRNLGDGTSDDIVAVAGDLPVVMLSASIDSSTAGHATVPGYVGAIAKPFNPMTLPALVASLIS